MASSNKVFIYKAKYTSSYSADDLTELFLRQDIFSRCDVLVDDFTHNWDGLDHATIVIPGGQTTNMGRDLKPKFEKINQSKCIYNYVGVCAGAFLAAENAQFFITDHSNLSDNKNVTLPDYLCSTKTVSAELGLVKAWDALGPFYPDARYKDKSFKDSYIPYRVNLMVNGKESSQLYIEGPGFRCIEETKGWEVVATYPGGPFEFKIKDSTIEFKEPHSFPAQIRKQADDKQGAVFLSGTHFEAGISNSKLLGFFKYNRDILSADDIKAIEAEGVKTIVPMLKETLKRKS